MNDLSKKQKELWDIADAELKKMGGIRSINRNPNKEIRDRAKQEGSKEWALCQSVQLISALNDNVMDDAFCQKLIDIINQ